MLFGRFPHQLNYYKRQNRPRRVKEKAINQQWNLSQKDCWIHQTDKEKLIKLLLQNSLSALSFNNHITVLTNGASKFEELLKAMEKARHHIHLEYYIYRDDEIGEQIKNLLIRKRAEGVEVRIILDGLGSHALSKKFLKEMQKAGIEVAMFFKVNLPLINSKINYRNHRKIVIIDGYLGFTGGMNIGDEYLSRNPKMGFWRDTHLKLTGECVHSLQTIFLEDWKFITGQEINASQYFPLPKEFGKQLAQVVAGSPGGDWEVTLQIFFTLLTAAEKRIYIETPYFIPDEASLLALKIAALQGIDVRIIVQGIPDHSITYWASRSYLKDLLKAGVKIYKYHKGILHAKVLLIDDNLGMVGSANFDLRSFRLDFEDNVLLYDREFAARLEKDFALDFVDSIEIITSEFLNRPYPERFKESGARLLSPLL